ncbi:nucleotide exchange factor GrpE [Corynebacterium sp. HMSC06C06]|uniref:nucleotide exchange factor GrpE n=1 Tax=Corynebacterium TaxID=1716 RepID=UPI000667E8FF|nr:MULTISPECIES: nucleotide exchange factor GrpE [Corynebacterium]EGT5590769.1 nucleotide exchange factor GrpE [Corynebacterium striatum]MDK8881362.1 nucleotide exchange factor GrpE [Corynebacterium striatum]OFT51469.1 nucleotide exchange factor GrpE [Corynebacterium sp. HMSC06C06]HAT1547116.1 nucleotide exchange factor GrpE [Corynebacterium striatum]
MTQDSGMPQNPGDPDNTDPEATSADRAEAAAAEAQEAQAAQDAQADSAEEAVLDPTLDADLEAALADVTEDDAAAEAEADATADAAEETGNGLEAQLAERTEDLQRLNAEYTNYRRRTERERQAVIEASKAKVLAEFLPILDDLELARQHGDLEAGPLKAIADKLTAVLDKNNLVAFGAEGDAFDPEIHEAVQDLSNGGEQAVGTVLRRGYKVGEKLVRTAMVIIADAPSATDASADGTGGSDTANSESDSE